jgi:cytochrome c oxidase subunit II
MVAIGIVTAIVVTLVAVLIPWLPDSASVQMDRITFVYWFATVISIGIFSLVIAVIVYSVINFRVAPDDESDGPPIHGHTGLEIVWTAIPAVLVIAIGVLSAVVLSRNAEAGDRPLTVNVYAQQFAWRFEYPDQGGLRSNELVLPVDRATEFVMTSADVIHSFWIPQMGQKQDVLPGVETGIVVTPTRTGDFTLICTELCGLGHATMRAPVHVLSQPAFDQWLAEQQKEAQGSADGASVFESSGCGGCHTFAAAGATGAIGPSLDELADAANQAGVPLDEFVRESVTDPNSYIEPGFKPDVMPQTFGDSLSSEELDALVAYLTGENG